MCGSFSCLAWFLAGFLLLESCASPQQIKKIVRTDLFSIGYGLSEAQIDLSSTGDDTVDMDMREGIFHILDGSGRKAMKLSSYGDLLALYYDKERLPEPRIVKTASPEAEKDGRATAISQGRYAVAVDFVSPSRIAVDSAQVVYIADRVKDPAARVFDAQSETYCDRIIRRFGAQGMELPHLGQEGPGGTPFPFITGLSVLEDDSLVVNSSSESFFLIHHFAREGNLLGTLKLGRSSLPTPKDLAAAEDGAKGQRINANLDSISESIGASSFEVTLKIDYYREFFDPESLVISRSEFAGSWIFVLEGRSGASLRSFNILQAGSEAPIPELIGMRSGICYFLSAAEESGARNRASPVPERIIQLIDGKGTVYSRFRIELPVDTKEIVSVKISSTGYIVGLLKTESAVHIVWWYYR